MKDTLKGSYLPVKKKINNLKDYFFFFFLEMSLNLKS